MKPLDLNNNSAKENIKTPTPKSNIFQAFGFCINGIRIFEPYPRPKKKMKLATEAPKPNKI